MSKHTPAPWHVSELDAFGNVSEYHIFIEPGIAVIERKVDGQDGCDMPDARLIAAAPELLEALQELLAARDDFDAEFHKQYVSTEWRERNLRVESAKTRKDRAELAARAAIAKATGEQP